MLAIGRAPHHPALTRPPTDLCARGGSREQFCGCEAHLRTPGLAGVVRAVDAVSSEPPGGVEVRARDHHDGPRVAAALGAYRRGGRLRGGYGRAFHERLLPRV